MPRWLTLLPNGTIIENTDEPTLEAMQQAVGGDLEALPSPIEGVSLFVNEQKRDGYDQSLPPNPAATKLMVNNLWPGTRLVGPMIFAGAPDPNDENGMLTELSDEQVASLREKLT